jgi:hypothetical protein
MAQVLTLPLDLSPDVTRRLCAQLERAAGTGIDLGSRQIQIAGVSDALTRSLQDLDAALRRMAAHLPADDPTASGLREAAGAMTSIARSVLGIAGGCEVQPASEV